MSLANENDLIIPRTVGTISAAAIEANRHLDRYSRSRASATVITRPGCTMSRSSDSASMTLAGFASPVVSNMNCSAGMSPMSRSSPGRRLSASEQHTHPSSSASTWVSPRRSAASSPISPNSFWMTPV